MYSSLDRIDIVLNRNVIAQNDHNVFLQTDHRSPGEIEADGPLATIFALIRSLNPLRSSDDPAAEVQYYCKEIPPVFLRQAIAAAGATLVVGDYVDEKNRTAYPPASPGVQVPDLEPLINQTLAKLADRVSQEEWEPLTLAGLEGLERKYQTREVSQENETHYWASVVSLGSFGGEILRR